MVDIDLLVKNDEIEHEVRGEKGLGPMGDNFGNIFGSETTLNSTEPEHVNIDQKMANFIARLKSIEWDKRKKKISKENDQEGDQEEQEQQDQTQEPHKPQDHDLDARSLALQKLKNRIKSQKPLSLQDLKDMQVIPQNLTLSQPSLAGLEHDIHDKIYSEEQMTNHFKNDESNVVNLIRHSIKDRISHELNEIERDSVGMADIHIF